jgi:ribosomal-protein-alanine N-acetyltransferase
VAIVPNKSLDASGISLSLIDNLFVIRLFAAASTQTLCLGETQLELVAITENGELVKPVPSLPPLAAEVVHATRQLYRTVGYELPWIGYLALENDICVGSCGFKSPPQNNRVEIAYFTFPGHESRGVATRMASKLIRLALDKRPAVTVAAQTLPEENASTSVLKKLRFRLTGTVEHAEDGLVWEWQLSDTSRMHNKRSQPTPT